MAESVFITNTSVHRLGDAQLIVIFDKWVLTLSLYKMLYSVVGCFLLFLRVKYD